MSVVQKWFSLSPMPKPSWALKHSAQWLVYWATHAQQMLYQEAHVTTCLQGSFHWAMLIQSHLLHSSDHTPELPEEIGCTKQPHCLRKCYPFLQAKMRGHFSWQCFKVHCLTKKQFLKGLPPILHPKKKKNVFLIWYSLTPKSRDNDHVVDSIQLTCIEHKTAWWMLEG